MSSTIYFLPESILPISSDLETFNHHELSAMLGYSPSADLAITIKNDKRFDSYRVADAWMLTRYGLIVIINDTTSVIEGIAYGGAYKSALLQFAIEYKMDPRCDFTPLIYTKDQADFFQRTNFLRDVAEKREYEGNKLAHLRYDEFISFVKDSLTYNGYTFEPLLAFYFGYDFFTKNLDDASALLSSNKYYSEYGSFGGFLMDCHDELSRSNSILN